MRALGGLFIARFGKARPSAGLAVRSVVCGRCWVVGVACGDGDPLAADAAVQRSGLPRRCGGRRGGRRCSRRLLQQRVAELPAGNSPQQTVMSTGSSNPDHALADERCTRATS